MKTIEHYAVKKYLGQRDLPVYKQIPAHNYIDWANFGAREAQRWISVEEELPEIDEFGVSENVILKLEVYGKKTKNTYECCIEAYVDHDSKTWHFMLPIDDKNLKLSPIAWRPIKRL